MTDDEIDAMPAGENMDVEIERRVFGTERGFSMVPMPYSTEWAAAGLLVEHLRQRGVYTSLYSSQHAYQAIVSEARTGFYVPVDAHTAPLAICRAALKAVRERA